MSGYDAPERLLVLALLMTLDVAASDRAGRWVDLGGDPFPAAGQDMIGSATDSEDELAGAMRGEHPVVVAGLLRLADGSEREALLRLGLRERFAPDGDDGPHVPVTERDGAFADAYSRLLLPALDGQARDQAAELLGRLGLSDRRGSSL